MKYDKQGTSMKTEQSLCTVCGARVEWQRLPSTTCDAVCAKAKTLGLTRGDQMRYDMRRSVEWGREALAFMAPIQREHDRFMQDLNYNQPYLNENYA